MIDIKLKKHIVMKAILNTFCLAFAALFAFSGCNYTVLNDGIEMEVVYIEAKIKNWQLNGEEGTEGCYQYQEFNFPEITSSVLEKGAVMVYYIDKEGRDNMLPLVLPYESGRETVVENIRFDCEKNRLTLIIEATDFMAFPPDRDIKFKVCILKPY